MEDYYLYFIGYRDKVSAYKALRKTDPYSDVKRIKLMPLLKKQD